MNRRCAPCTARAARLSGLAALCFVLTQNDALAQQAPPPGAPLERAADRQRGLDAALTPEREIERQALLSAARAALEAGEPQRAAEHLDTAANMSHAADTELLQLQTQLQRGEFRQALAFAAHTAGAHLGEPQALALYIWLLALCEQTDYAGRLLDAGLGRLPKDERLLALRADLDRWQNPSQPLEPGKRPQPIASGEQPRPSARQLASGLLLSDGRLAMVPSKVLGARSVLWLRNGLGQTRRARPATTPAALESLGLSLWRLESPLPAPALVRAPRDAFAGSPASAITLLDSDNADPAWPALRSGFVGRVSSRGQALGFDLVHGSNGGPVLDTSGRLIGIGFADTAIGPQLLALSALLDSGEPLLQALPVANQAAPLTPDRLYELALPFTLQVLGD